MKKALPYILYSLVILAASGLLIYQGFVVKNLETRDFTKCILIIAAALVGMLRPKQRKTVGSKKVLYQKAYGEFIQNAFSDDPKLEKKFYAAVDDYNQNKCGSALGKLAKLRGECTRTADIYAVTVFSALCSDDLQLYEDAIKFYSDAAGIRSNTTLHSNMGLCLQRLGRLDEAEAAYDRATQIDPKNAFAWTNLSALYFRKGEYDISLSYAERAIEIDGKMPQALSSAAICSALLDDQEKYERYYRQAVACGYDGKKIKNAIQNMDPSL